MYLYLCKYYTFLSLYGDYIGFYHHRAVARTCSLHWLCFSPTYCCQATEDKYVNKLMIITLAISVKAKYSLLQKGSCSHQQNIWCDILVADTFQTQFEEASLSSKQQRQTSESYHKRYEVCSAATASAIHRILTRKVCLETVFLIYRGETQRYLPKQ